MANPGDPVGKVAAQAIRGNEPPPEAVRPRPACTLQSSHARFLLDLWNRLRGQELLPKREAFTIRQLRPIIAHVFMVEYRDPENVVVRLQGTGLADELGVDLTGINLVAEGTAEHRAARARRWAVAISGPAGYFSRVEARDTSGNSWEYEQIALPLAQTPGNPAWRFIGTLQRLSENPEGYRPPADPTPKIMLPGTINYFDIGAGPPARMDDHQA